MSSYRLPLSWSMNVSIGAAYEKNAPDTVKPMDKQATTDCSFSSDENVEDVAVKAKIEEIIVSLQQ